MGLLMETTKSLLGDHVATGVLDSVVGGLHAKVGAYDDALQASRVELAQKTRELQVLQGLQQARPSKPHPSIASWSLHRALLTPPPGLLYRCGDRT